MLVLIFLVTTNAVIMALASAFGVLARRDQLGFLPVRDAAFFVSEFFPIYEAKQADHGGSEPYSAFAAS
jgi:hypothetical protein